MTNWFLARDAGLKPRRYIECKATTVGTQASLLLNAVATVTSKRGPSTASRARKSRGKGKFARDSAQDDGLRQRRRLVGHPGEWFTSKRDSSTACPGASRKTKSAGHFARNDGVARASRPFARGRWRASSQASSPGTACCAPTEDREVGGQKEGEVWPPTSAAARFYFLATSTRMASALRACSVAFRRAPNGRVVWK